MNAETKELLLQKGIRPSPQRVAVFEEVYHHTTHPSVEMVYNALREKLPTLSRTTVYSTMQLLAEKNLILEVRDGEGEIRYDGFTQFHAHFRCRHCNGLYDIDVVGNHDKPFVRMPEGYVPDEEQLIYYGLCPNCSTTTKGIQK